LPARTVPVIKVPNGVTDAQKYWYFGAQRRWFVVLRFLTFIGLIVSLSRFALEDPHISAMLIVVIMMTAVSLIGLYSSTRPRALNQTDHEQRVITWSPAQLPSVDVFLPSAGEPLEILSNTYRHVAALDYPGRVTVYALDDSGSEAVRDLAEHHGFRYISRPDRGRMKKAGNLAYAYDRTDGDMVAIFDADFAPRPEFLAELLPYFDEPEVGIVQSPQFFETHKNDHWLQRAAGADQELFYRWVQPSRDALGAPICVGTCALYRREALRAAGGFAQISHSEDVHTGIAMMQAGYAVRYIPVILAEGLCPDGLPPFVSQQYRWCAGSLSLLSSSSFHAMNLSWKQRLCFWSGFGYYLSTAIAAFTAFLPPIYLLWVHPESIHDRNYLLLLPVIAAYPLIVVLYRGRWDFGVLRVQLAQAFSHAVAIWDTWRGHTADWVPTGAAHGSPLGVRIGRLMATWLIAVQTLLWVGIVRDLFVMSMPLRNLYPLILFTAFAAYLQIPLIFETLRVTTSPRSARPASVTA
jgi:cellulose synthase (UDP-forming)